MDKSRSPCHECKDRREKCHADCERYAAFQEYLKAEKDSRKIEAGFLDYYRRKSYILKKRRGRK